MLFNLLEAAASSAEQSSSSAKSGGSGYVIWIIFGALIVFILINSIFSRKRNKKMAEEQEKKMAIKPGYLVTTIGGVIGVVTEVNEEENSFVLKTGDGENACYLKFDKQAIYMSKAPETENGTTETADPFVPEGEENAPTADVAEESGRTEDAPAADGAEESETEEKKD